jgi:hypothetical protein
MSKINATSGGGYKVNYGRLGNKINEVKEVVQNRPDADIAKVLEALDTDVGRAIDAFITGKKSFTNYV